MFTFLVPGLHCLLLALLLVPTSNASAPIEKEISSWNLYQGLQITYLSWFLEVADDRALIRDILQINEFAVFPAEPSYKPIFSRFDEQSPRQLSNEDDDDYVEEEREELSLEGQALMLLEVIQKLSPRSNSLPLLLDALSPELLQILISMLPSAVLERVLKGLTRVGVADAVERVLAKRHCSIREIVGLAGHCHPSTPVLSSMAVSEPPSMSPSSKAKVLSPPSDESESVDSSSPPASLPVPIPSTPKTPPQSNKGKARIVPKVFVSVTPQPATRQLTMSQPVTPKRDLPQPATPKRELPQPATPLLQPSTPKLSEARLPEDELEMERLLWSAPSNVAQKALSSIHNISHDKHHTLFLECLAMQFLRTEPLKNLQRVLTNTSVVHRALAAISAYESEQDFDQENVLIAALEAFAKRFFLKDEESVQLRRQGNPMLSTVAPMFLAMLATIKTDPRKSPNELLAAIVDVTKTRMCPSYPYLSFRRPYAALFPQSFLFLSAASSFVRGSRVPIPEAMNMLRAFIMLASSHRRIINWPTINGLLSDEDALNRTLAHNFIIDTEKVGMSHNSRVSPRAASDLSHVRKRTVAPRTVSDGVVVLHGHTSPRGMANANSQTAIPSRQVSEDSAQVASIVSQPLEGVDIHSIKVSSDKEENVSAKCCIIL